MRDLIAGSITLVGVVLIAAGACTVAIAGAVKSWRNHA